VARKAYSYTFAFHKQKRYYLIIRKKPLGLGFIEATSIKLAG
jgi:hypothetical protein